MFLDIEKGRTTKHEKIHIVQPNNFDSRTLRLQVKELEKFANRMQQNEVVEKLCEIVPSFHNKKGK